MPTSEAMPRGVESIDKQRSAAFQQLQQDRQLILKLISLNQEQSRLDGAQYVADAVADSIIKAQAGWLASFLGATSFRFAVYRNQARNFIKSFHAGGVEFPVFDPAIFDSSTAAVGVDPEYHATDRRAIFNNLQVTLAKRMARYEPEDQKKIERMLRILGGLMHAQRLEELSLTEGITPAALSRIYKRAITDFPELFGQLPSGVKDIHQIDQSLSRKSSTASHSAQATEQRQRKAAEHIPLLRGLLSELQESQTPLPGTLLEFQKNLVVQVLEHLLGLRSTEQIDEQLRNPSLTKPGSRASRVSRLYRRIRGGVVQHLGLMDVPQATTIAAVARREEAA